MNTMNSFVKNTSDKFLSTSEEKALLMAAQKGDRSATEKLVNNHMRYVISIAKNYYAKSLSQEDLIVCGCIGLIKAIRKFNINSSNKLITYARSWIEKEIGDEIKNLDSMIHLPQNVQIEKNRYTKYMDSLPETMTEAEKMAKTAAECGLTSKRINNFQTAAICNESLDSFLGDDSDSETRLSTIKDSTTQSAEETTIRKELGEKLEAFLEKLTPRESTVIKARAGFGYETPMSLGEIGDMLGISKSAVRDIEKKVQAKARLKENSKYFDGWTAA